MKEGRRPPGLTWWACRRRRGEASAESWSCSRRSTARSRPQWPRGLDPDGGRKSWRRRAGIPCRRRRQPPPRAAGARPRSRSCRRRSCSSRSCSCPWRCSP
uniref:Uncharacterized protein n=1 Tax=Triticum urartu TaxID=4572 RepID=A0A8R7PSX1_TRIUA